MKSNRDDLTDIDDAERADERRREQEQRQAREDRERGRRLEVHRMAPPQMDLRLGSLVEL